MKFIIFLILTIVILFSCAQQVKNPSIRETVKKSISESISLGVKEYKSGNLQSAKGFFLEALKEAYSIDNTEEIINIEQNLAITTLRSTNLSEASNYIFSAKFIAEKENITLYNYIIYLTIGKYYDRTADTPDDFETAISWYQKAATAAKDDEDRASAYNNIGVTKRKQKKLDEAVRWLDQARRINEGEKNYAALGDNYYYLGQTYEDQGLLSESLKNYLSALNYDKIAEKSVSILDDLKRIAQIYSRMSKFDEALYYYKKALNTAQSIDRTQDIQSLQNTINSMQK